MAGRKSKYNEETAQIIVDKLALGATIRDACYAAGISVKTFFNWRNDPKLPFLQLITRAQAAARLTAVEAIHGALETQDIITETAEIVTETRLKRDGSEYEYKRTYTRKQVTHNPPDWRAAVEYLKRRDNRHWSDKVTVKHQDWRSMAIEDIRAGRITYPLLAKAFDDSLAAELFREAGIPIPLGEGKASE